jgi:hypothetical protein
MSRAVVRSADTSILEEPFLFTMHWQRGSKITRFNCSVTDWILLADTLMLPFVFLLADVGVIQIEPRFVWPFIAAGNIVRRSRKKALRYAIALRGCGLNQRARWWPQYPPNLLLEADLHSFDYQK